MKTNENFPRLHAGESVLTSRSVLSIIMIVTIIMLPTILCIILFCRMNCLQKDFSELKAQLESSVQLASDENSPGRKQIQASLNKNQAEPENSSKTYQETQPEATETETEARTTVEEALKQGRKVVYLTFDDGPSDNTDALLDVLAEYNVKATFFVNGYEGYEEALNRIVNEGHTLALHTYTHDYAHVYESVESFSQEVESLQDYLEKVTGTRPYIFRFPGGSSNSQAPLPISQYIDYLNKNNLVFLTGMFHPETEKTGSAGNRYTIM